MLRRAGRAGRPSTGSGLAAARGVNEWEMPAGAFPAPQTRGILLRGQGVVNRKTALHLPVGSLRTKSGWVYRFGAGCGFGGCAAGYRKESQGHGVNRRGGPSAPAPSHTAGRIAGVGLCSKCAMRLPVPVVIIGLLEDRQIFRDELESPVSSERILQDTPSSAQDAVPR